MLQGRPSPSSTSHSRPKAPSATTTPRSTLLAISTCEQHDDHHIKLIANLISGTLFSEFLTLTHTGRRSRCTGAARLLWRRGRLLRRVRKTHISFVLKMLFCTQNDFVLPRQARDKHRESKTQKKRVAVFAGRPTFLYSFDHTPYESVNEGRISSHLGADFEFSLWLSRACLGKMTVYIYKWPCLVPPRCGQNSKRPCDPFSLKSSVKWRSFCQDRLGTTA
jgi:hypothetical protein